MYIYGVCSSLCKSLSNANPICKTVCTTMNSNYKKFAILSNYARTFCIKDIVICQINKIFMDFDAKSNKSNQRLS